MMTTWRDRRRWRKELRDVPLDQFRGMVRGLTLLPDPRETALGRGMAMATGTRPCAGYGSNRVRFTDRDCHWTVLERIAERLDPDDGRSLRPLVPER